MLIKCPECDLQVSDKAISCPHCGYPMSTKPVRFRPSAKHRRLPNGFGQITELKNPNLRNRFRVMISDGKYPNGRPISKLLKPKAYFKTYNEAYEALVEYNKNPYDLNLAMTVKELYEMWSKEYFEKTAKSGARSVKAAWDYCSEIYDMNVRDIRPRHIKGVMENGIAIRKGVKKSTSAGTKLKIKNVFNMMLDYALEHEIVDKNYSRDFAVSDDIIQQTEDDKTDHIPFTENEIKLLISKGNEIPNAKIVLYQCYSGWRPQEIGEILLSDVHLDEEYIIGGMKSEAGKQRVVPIHPFVREIVKEAYEHAKNINSEYLFNYEDGYSTRNTKLNYDRYWRVFNQVVEDLQLDPKHRPHDPRKHFITEAKKYKVDEYAIKYIVGHEIDDITEKVYTERSKEWLIEETKKIKVLV